MFNLSKKFGILHIYTVVVNFVVTLLLYLSTKHTQRLFRQMFSEFEGLNVLMEVVKV